MYSRKDNGSFFLRDKGKYFCYPFWCRVERVISNIWNLSNKNKNSKSEDFIYFYIILIKIFNIFVCNLYKRETIKNSFQTLHRRIKTFN